MSPFILYIFLLFNFTINIMVFPFKQALEHKNGDLTPDKEAYNGTNFAIDYFDTKLYTQIKIGNPYQEVKVLLAGALCAFKIGQSKYCINLDEYKSYYNRNKSSDFTYTPKYSHEDWEFNDTIGSTAEDTLYTYTDLNLKNEIKFKNVGFYLGSDTNDKLCGIIGLEKDNFVCNRTYNIVKDCKDKKYINNRKFMLKYNTINEGLYIIGSEFKDVIDNYDENKTSTIKLIAGTGIYKFKFKINKVQIIGDENVTIDTNIEGIINNDFSFIILGSQYFNNYSHYFFSKYLENGICTKNTYDYKPELLLSEKYDVIECDKKKFGENDMESLPKLYIYIGDYFSQKKIFFDYKDLFTETKYKYFFNIIFDKNNKYNIDLGKLFLKKYPINFDFENEVIDIYDNYIEKQNDNKGNQNGNNDNNMTLYIILACILVVITGVLGYFLGKYLNKIRKKRANELKDDYEYNESPAEPINRESSLDN